MFRELLKRNTTTPMQYHRLLFIKSRWCHTLSTASSSQDILQHTATLTCRNALYTKAEEFHANMIPHDFLAFLHSYNRIQFEITDLSSNWYFSSRNAAAAKNHSLYKRLSKTSIPFLPSLPFPPPPSCERILQFPVYQFTFKDLWSLLKNPPCTSSGLKLTLWQKQKASHALLSNQWSHTV